MHVSCVCTYIYPLRTTYVCTYNINLYIHTYIHTHVCTFVYTDIDKLRSIVHNNNIYVKAYVRIYVYMYHACIHWSPYIIFMYIYMYMDLYLIVIIIHIDILPGDTPVAMGAIDDGVAMYIYGVKIALKYIHNYVCKCIHMHIIA